MESEKLGVLPSTVEISGVDQVEHATCPLDFLCQESPSRQYQRESNALMKNTVHMNSPIFSVYRLEEQPSEVH